MNTITALLLVSLIGMSAAASCLNEAVAVFNGLYTAGNSPGTSKNDLEFKYCKSLKEGAEVCCEAEVIDKFQEKADTIVDAYIELAKKRDELIVTSRKGLIETTDEMTTFTTAANEITSTLDGMTSFAGAATLKTKLTSITGDVTTLTDNLEDLEDSFNTYQTSRQTCINTLVNVQAAAWCSACVVDPATSDGWDVSGTPVLTPHTDIKQRVRDACANFYEAAEEQNAILRLQVYGKAFGDFATKIKEIKDAADDNAREPLITTLITGNGGLTNLNTVDDILAEISCTTSDCTDVWTHVFSSKLGTGENVVFGGKPSSRRLLRERKLAGDFKPAEDEAQIEVDFPRDPAGVNSGATLGGIVACFIAGFVTLLM